MRRAQKSRPRRQRRRPKSSIFPPKCARWYWSESRDADLKHLESRSGAELCGYERLRGCHASPPNNRRQLNLRTISRELFLYDHDGLRSAIGRRSTYCLLDWHRIAPAWASVALERLVSHEKGCWRQGSVFLQHFCFILCLCSGIFKIMDVPTVVCWIETCGRPAGLWPCEASCYLLTCTKPGVQLRMGGQCPSALSADIANAKPYMPIWTVSMRICAFRFLSLMTHLFLRSRKLSRLC